MTAKGPNEPGSEKGQAAGMLFYPKERAVCERVAAGAAPWSYRAQALLALDEGATQSGAGERAGLTHGQVRYWLGRFRQDGLSIFPEGEEAEATETKAAGAAKKSKKKKPKKKKQKKKTAKAKKTEKTKAKKKPKKKNAKKKGKG
jgi:outer membrane biosynthesis protein TonB